MKLHLHPRRRQAAFSLMELLVVIAIIALLAAMTMGAFTFAQKSGMRNRTTAMHRAVISGLENYHSEYGEYPMPASNETDSFNGKTYNIGGAAMLYQALSGDGTNKIKLASGGGTGSDGQWGAEEKPMLVDMPKEMLNRGGKNSYMLLDSFYHPFQYTKGGTTQAINSSFDLWSYGEDEDNTRLTDKASKQNPMTTAKWIKNF